MATQNANSGGLRTGGGTGAIVCIAQLDYALSANTETAVSYTLGVYIYCSQYGYTTSGVLSSQLSSSGQTTRSTSGGSCDLSTGERLKLSGNWTYTFPKKQTVYTQRIYFQVSSTGNTVRGTSSGYLDVSIPALASYQVSYSANGGTGTIAPQPKYYGINLPLSDGTGFERNNHTLTGWNTSANGTGTAYALGATYTANSPLALHAQWHMDYIKPTITHAQAYRVSSSSSSTLADDGAYIYVSFSYTGGKLPTDIEYTRPDYTIKINGVYPPVASGKLEASGSWPTSTIAYGPYATNESHSVEIKLYDDTDTEGITETLTVGLPMFPIDLRIDSNNQTCMGVMTAAQDGKTLSMPLINVTGVSINNSEMIDFVVEEGEQAVTSNGSSPYNFGDGYWRWREWNSGKVEIWYYGSVLLDTTGGSGQVAGLYRYLRRITFPNNYALYKCIGIVNGTTGGNWLNCGGLFKVKNGTDVHEEPFTKIEVMAYCISVRPSQNQENTSIYICGEKNTSASS